MGKPKSGIDKTVVTLRIRTEINNRLNHDHDTTGFDRSLIVEKALEFWW